MLSGVDTLEIAWLLSLDRVLLEAYFGDSAWLG
jgi:hypothetical protein